MKEKVFSALLAGLMAAMWVWAQGNGVVVIESFDAKGLPKNLGRQDVEARIEKAQTGRALVVRFKKAEAPGISLTPADGKWDWSRYSGLTMDVTNAERQPVELFIRLDGVNKAGKDVSVRATMTIGPGERRPVTYFFSNNGAGPYWGMRGIPVLGPVILRGPGLMGEPLDPSNVTGLRVYLRRPERECTLTIDNVRVFEPGSPLERLVPFPFIDRFGQYIHADWPGKIHNEAELQKAREGEQAALKAMPDLAGRDKFGGWADGPQLKATGWFRTEKVDGKWWLVTPEGRLFFSVGVDCVRVGDATFVDGRDGWFEWLPEAQGEFQQAVGERTGAYMMAETIGGKGRVVNFYEINQIRKFGPDWRTASRDLAYQRLKAWGFNTLGNWSDREILAKSPMAFTVTGQSGRGRFIEASAGFWGKMMDVYDPGFAPTTEEGIARLAADFGTNPLVLGYFVDNEDAWEGVPTAALASPPDQPARRVFVEDLKTQYGAIERINEAWETQAKDWDTLRIPPRPNDRCRAALDAFEYKFARHYFEVIVSALRKYAPNQLYLGCRFALRYCPKQVMRACADVADVVSINGYLPEIPADMFSEIDKPIIIGEFHFGALDRGMFHQGLQSAANQEERAGMYAHYVKSVAANPRFVGCHWFEYVDQPTTGRSHDGENYNIGLVSIVDVPYPELTAAARQVHGAIYKYRSGIK